MYSSSPSSPLPDSSASNTSSIFSCQMYVRTCSHCTSSTDSKPYRSPRNFICGLLRRASHVSFMPSSPCFLHLFSDKQVFQSICGQYLWYNHMYPETFENSPMQVRRSTAHFCCWFTHFNASHNSLVDGHILGSTL